MPNEPNTDALVALVHESAMNVVDLADRAQALAQELYRIAFARERMAAEVCPNMEPSRSVLFRSAASLALQCGDVKSAEELIAKGLAGNPPAEIAEELRSLLKPTTGA